jgi:transcriptional regulator with XRE-family HTH domain
MNFGERIKQLRTERSMTQPQLAEAIGIEQSYLSKLENDKSVPSPDIFQAIMRAFNLQAEALLAGVDDNIVRGELKQIPEVAEYLKRSMLVKVHSIKAWLFGSAAACVVGLTLFVAGYRALLVPAFDYSYTSAGIELPGEPSNIFEESYLFLNKRMSAGEINNEEREKLALEYAKRQKVDNMTVDDYRGLYFSTPVEGGTRTYKLVSSMPVQKLPNRILMLLGSLLTFGGVFGFFVEYRLRSVRL